MWHQRILRQSFSIGVVVALTAGTCFGQPTANHTVQLAQAETVERAWLGVIVTTLNHATADQLGIERGRGAMISDFKPDSPARRSGLLLDDVILTIDGKSVNGVRDLAAYIAGLQPNTEIVLEVLRKGTRKSVPVVLGRWRKSE